MSSAYSNYPSGVDGSHPYFNQPDPPECPNRDCMATLEPEWEWCPYCGWHIDWDEIERQASEPDWYAEESEQFYRNECVGDGR